MKYLIGEFWELSPISGIPLGSITTTLLLHTHHTQKHTQTHAHRIYQTQQQQFQGVAGFFEGGLLRVAEGELAAHCRVGSVPLADLL